METLKEKIANKCKHFHKLSNDRCKAGVPFADVKEYPFKLPCFKKGEYSSSKLCPKAEWKTPDEVKAQLEQIEAHTKKQLNAYAAVKNHIEKTKEQAGAIECPSCKGKLKFAQSSSNNHIWVACSCGIRWME